MDIDAGRYQSAGVPMARLGQELFDLMIAAASGEKTVGTYAYACICMRFRS